MDGDRAFFTGVAEQVFDLTSGFYPVFTFGLMILC
jgi:hypothetical protein